MNTREKTLNLVKLYREHQRQFESLYNALHRAAPANNDYGIELLGGTGIAKEFTILAHHCRMAFDIWLDSESFPGKVSFLRVLGPERTAPFLDLYFDAAGNITDDPHGTPQHAITDADAGDWLALRVVDAFFHTREGAH